jgi:hypothetical protein
MPSSSPYYPSLSEYGASQNLSSYLGGDDYLPSDITTNGSQNSYSPVFTWNAEDGYTIGFTHNHPAGTGPDLIDLQTTVSAVNLSTDLQNDGQDAINFAQQNMSITTITSTGTYITTVNNWSAVSDMMPQISDAYNTATSEYTTANAGDPSLAGAYGLISAFGNNVTIPYAPTGSTNFQVVKTAGKTTLAMRTVIDKN